MLKNRNQNFLLESHRNQEKFWHCPITNIYIYIWIKVQGGGSKKVESSKGIDIKNRFSILDKMDDNSNIVRNRE